MSLAHDSYNFIKDDENQLLMSNFSCKPYVNVENPIYVKWNVMYHSFKLFEFHAQPEHDAKSLSAST